MGYGRTRAPGAAQPVALDDFAMNAQPDAALVGVEPVHRAAELIERLTCFKP